MRIMVTGGAGFIGSHICEALLEGNDVCCVDDMSAGYLDNIPGKVIHYKADVSILPAMDLLFANIKPDMVYHQAASKKNICLADPVRDMVVNIQGAYNIALMCKKYGAKMYHASTGSVYGEAVQKQDENHPINPVSYYGISKFAGERYARLIADAVVLRYFHVYGIRQEVDQDKGGVIAIWIDRIKKGLPVVIYGDGTQERSFTYVKDVAKVNMMELDPGVYNCASGLTYSLNDVIRLLKHELGDFEVQYKNWLPGDIKKFDVCSKKLGYKNWTALETAIKLMLWH